MPRRALDPELCSEFAAKLRTSVDGKISRKLAAATLGVSRQMLDIYLKGRAAPGPDVILRAMKAWGFSLKYRGREVTSAQLIRPRVAGPQTTAEQLLLPLKDAIQSLSDEDIHVKVAKKDADRIQLDVSIRFAS